MSTLSETHLSEYVDFINREINMANEQNDPYAKEALSYAKATLKRFAYFKKTGNHPPLNNE